MPALPATNEAILGGLKNTAVMFRQARRLVRSAFESLRSKALLSSCVYEDW